MTSFQIEPQMIPKGSNPRLYVRLNFQAPWKWLCVDHRFTGSGDTARNAYIKWKQEKNFWEDRDD